MASHGRTMERRREWMSTHPDPMARARQLPEMIPILIEQDESRQPTPAGKIDPDVVGR